ncbi:YlxQ family RNA-binding protein [Alkalibacillus haloalkaliphilus]|uniref:YlxQ family RNA-binding protein n=1 Tax=Alkalibacillus haloalkaliphilus TaxID=94136 RepID=UPI002936C0A8|nr:YlxQ family RNA-binding protein [Alkalibacillus haloalkaliphilus]MDV2580643.1 YlxQ family RNA-binding protein [Alkalibacillus haloalkaliphilus]
MSHNYLNLLGLAFRARKITLGEEAIIDAIRSQQAKLVIIAEDASQNTSKKLTDKCRSYNVPFRIADDRNTLSQAIGKQGRVAIAVNDEGFSNKLMQLLPE